MKLDTHVIGLPQPYPAYCALKLGSDGRILSVVTLEARNDREALRAAQKLAAKVSVDLWDGLRFVEHLSGGAADIPTEAAGTKWYR